jgi:hypothetical protein
VFVKIFCSLLLFAIGIAVVYFCARTNTLECTRDRNNIISADIIRTGIKYRKKERIPPGELIRAELDAFAKSTGRAFLTYRIRLVLSDYPMFLTHIYSSSYASTLNKVDRINYFLDTASLRSISIAQDDRLGGFIVGMVFLMAAIIVLIAL